MAASEDSQSEPRDFLFEIGTEELPAAAAASAAEAAGTLAHLALKRHHLEVDPSGISVWVTPRRIAVYVSSLPAMQRDQEVAERGPVVSNAFDEAGNPTKAAEGFARAKGIETEDLQVREHEGREFVFAVHRQEGRPTPQILPAVCSEILTGISFPKTMRWDGADLRFSRPVRWLLAKYGEETIGFEAGGIKSGGVSRGHRFLGEPDIAIDSASSYKGLLAENRVIVDQDERRQAILAGLATQAGKLGASFIDPAHELEEVMYLVENPSVHTGDFGEGHLRLPDRVLVTCMQSHQRYFPLTTEDGSLMAGFLYVMNGDPAAAPAITEGNERVLEGRIEDAEFSFDQDLKVGIEAMAAKLGSVVFHRRLGSLADKTARLEQLVEDLANIMPMCGPELKSAVAAARLAKADQVSIMVQEFSDLEGYIGSVYANMEGYASEVCTAIEEHYFPTAAGGEIPSTVAGALLSIADKVDNLIGAFAVDELPTGSRDPYGLRRAAIGITEICSRYGFDFDLMELLASAHRLYIKQKADISRETSVVESAFEFVCDRVQQRLVEKGIPVEVVEGARAARQKSIIRLISLAEALNAFRFQPPFEDLHTAFFRLSKIAAKSGADLKGVEVDESLFDSETEGELYGAIGQLSPELESLIEARDYERALGLAAGIRPLVDRFFDEVLVMAEDQKVRSNRLALVSQGAGILLGLGDPMRVAAAPG